MLKFAILVATAGLVASVVGDTAATIVLFAAAIVALAGFWWKFAVPFAQLTLSLKTLPKDLEEAAFIDGASHMEIYRNVILPLARPALAGGVVEAALMRRGDDAEAETDE